MHVGCVHHLKRFLPRQLCLVQHPNPFLISCHRTNLPFPTHSYAINPVERPIPAKPTRAVHRLQLYARADLVHAWAYALIKTASVLSSSYRVLISTSCCYIYRRLHRTTPRLTRTGARTRKSQQPVASLSFIILQPRALFQGVLFLG